MNYTKPITVNLNIGDQLTSISCGHVIVEFIKFIVYQRQQIPYAYTWLKQIINIRKECYEKEENLKESFKSENHFRVASTALTNLDFILKSILHEMNGSTIPEEICIAFGSCPISCREVYRLVMPTSCHKPQCHSPLISSDQKIHRDVFRTLVTEEKLSKIFLNPSPPTNLYVLVKKRIVNSQETIINTDSFAHSSGFMIPRNSKIVVIDFRGCNQEGLKCCSDFQIFGNAENEDRLFTLKNEDENDLYEIESTNTSVWYESSYVMRGFKDCIENGSSVTNTWVSS